MAKSESTAVNELISLVQGGTPKRAEPADDLFGSPKATSPRMSGSVPTMRSAGDVAPLPPQRAPIGTSQLVVNQPVRMTTAPPSRTTTIPPLPQQTGGAPERPSQLPPPMPRISAPQLATRPTVPAQPPVATRPARAPSPSPTAEARPAQRRAPSPSPTAEARPAQRRALSPSPSAEARTAQPRPSSQHPTVDARPALPRPSGAQPAQRVTAAQPAQPRVTPSQPVQAQRRVTPSQPVQAQVNGAQGRTKQRTTGAQRTTPPKTTPVAAPFENPHDADAYERPAIDRTGDVISADNWFEASRMVEKIDETWVGTQPAPKRRDASAALKKILLPLAVLSVVSAGVAYVVFSHHGTKTAPPVTHVAAPAKVALTVSPAQVATARSTESANAATATAGGTQPERPAPSAAPITDPQVAAHPNANDVKIISKGSSDSAPQQVAAAAPAPQQPAVAAPVPTPTVAAIAEAAPVVHEVPTGHGMVKLVDVRIDSKPSGATVMLVDNGKTSFLGTTPVAASVDPSRSYDVVLTLDGRPTQIAHLDPTKAQKLEISLGMAGAKSEVAKSPARSAQAAPARKHVAASAPSGSLADPGFEAPASPKADAAPKADAGGDGTLMVSSKPPCEIWIDGKDTGLTTPQRSMSLSAGPHKVTFSNPSENITKTVTVKITADQSTKLIQNLMQ